MDITKTSIILKGINKIDLSNFGQIEEQVKNSLLYRSLAWPFTLFKPLRCKLNESSLLSQYIDQLILLNVIILLIAITFCPTVILGLLIATALCLTGLKWVLNPEEGYNFTIFDIPISVYIGIAIISVCFSSYFIPSAKGLAKLLTYFASYIVFTNTFKGNIWKIYFILGTLALTGGLEAIYGIFQNFTGIEALATWQDPDDIKAGREMSRVYGTLLPYNPNLLAGYLLPIFPCALGLGSILLTKKRWLYSSMFFGLSLAVLVCIVFTGSRGAYIGVVLMGICTYLIAGHLIWHNFQNTKYAKYLKLGWLAAGIGGCALVIIAVLAMPALHDRIMSIFTLRGNSSNSFRMNVYLASFEMFKDNWLIGIGPGNTTFRLVYGFYMYTGFDALGTYSVPLEIAVEMGAIGLLAFLWMLLVFTSNGIKTFISNVCIEIKLLIATIFIAFAGIAGQAIFDTIWYRPQVHVIFWLLVAMLGCIVTNKVVLNKSNE